MVCRYVPTLYRDRMISRGFLKWIGVATSQGIMVPRFCSYKPAFRSILYKSKVRSGIVCLQKYHGFLDVFFHVFFLFD